MAKCLSCDAELREGAKFCGRCGAKVGADAFCAECGAKLFPGEAFCTECGTPVGGAAEASEEPRKRRGRPPKAEQADEAPARDVYGCSEKQGDMVYVPGKGLYFLHEDNLFLLRDGETKPKQLTKTRKEEYGLANLNYYEEKLYFFTFTIPTGEASLSEYDTETGERRNFKVDTYPYSNSSRLIPRAIVKNGLLYFISSMRLVTMKLNGEIVSKQDLPELKWKDVPEDWVENWAAHNGVPEDRNERFGDTRWDAFYVHGGYGYVCSSVCFAIRFRLDDTSDYALLPLDCCGAYRGFGMISVYDDRVLAGVGEYGKQLVRTPIAEGDVRAIGQPMRELDLNEYAQTVGEYSGGYENGESTGWWRMGSRYFISRLMLDMDGMKATKLNWFLSAADFAELPDGSVCVFDGHYGVGRRIYRLPPRFWVKVCRQEDLAQYLVVDLDA